MAVADDITATYWTPAGLAQLAGGLTNKELRTQVAIQHATRKSGLGHFNYLAVGRKLKARVALAFSWIHAGIDEIPIFPPFDPNITPGDRRYTENIGPLLRQQALSPIARVLTLLRWPVAMEFHRNGGIYLSQPLSHHSR